MKRLTFIFLLFVSLASLAGVVRNFPTRTVEEVTDGIIVTYSFDNPEILESKYYNGTKYVSYDGFGLDDNDGEPCVPFRNDMFLVPNGCDVTVSIIDSVYTDTTFVLSPSMPVQKDNNSPVKRQSIIPYRGFFPNTIIHSTGVFHNREDALVNISISPVKYNYQTKTVRIYSYIKYKITYSGLENKSKGDRASLVRKICQNTPVRASSADSTYRNDKHYLIITTTEYQNSLDEFVRWKRLKGYNVHVARRAKGAWTVPAVTDTIQNYFNTDSTHYLLIVGDIDDVPADTMTFKGDMGVTDLQYGLPINNIPQIRRGRIPVKNTTELTRVLNKIVKYEQTPVIDESFYNTALHCAHFQDGDVDTTAIKDGYEDRYFTLCAEELRDYMTNNYGKEIIRGYACLADINPQHWNNTNYSNGSSIPPYLRRGAFNWSFRRDDIQHAIEEGTFYVLYRGHGGTNSWYSPGFCYLFMHPFTNGDKLPFIFSIACRTGQYNSSFNCLAEDLLKLRSGGCVGMIAATQDSYSGYNDAMTYGMFDAIWPGFTPQKQFKRYGGYQLFTEPTYEVGDIMDLGLLRMSETWGGPPSNAQNTSYGVHTRRLFHCFCDPSMMLYTENPRYFYSPAIHLNNDTLYVNTSEQKCKINIVKNTTGEVYSYFGDNVRLYIGDEDVSVCIDKHNFVPYIWHRNLCIQNEDFVYTSKDYHAHNVKVGKHVTDQKPQGNVNVINSTITIKADKLVLDKGTNINIGSVLNIKKNN